MKRIAKYISVLTLLLVSVFGLTGCALINVNAERDNAQVIATIDGEDLLKSYYNNNLALVQMSYEINDAQWPTGSSLKTLKENLYDDIIQTKVFALKAMADNETIDEEEVETGAQEQIEELQESVGEDLYKKIINDNYSTVEDFQTWMVEFSKDQEYAAKVTDKFEEEFDADPYKYLDVTVGKINDTDVTKGEYYYQYVLEEINSRMSTGSSLSTEPKAMKATNKEIFETIELADANLSYVEDHDITIPQEDITSAENMAKQMDGYVFNNSDTQKNSFIQQYFLTPEVYNDYQKQYAKATAANNAIKDYLIENTEISDSEAEKYYNDNIKKYDTTKVSAMHILTEDKDAADAIYDEAKDITSKEDFEALIEKYDGVDGVQEATDLEPFTYADMVQEFSDAAFSADLNTVLRPVESEFGYHIIYVYDKEEGETESFDEVKSEIVDQLKDEKGQEEYDKLEEDFTKGVKYDIPDDVLTPLEEYAQELENEYHVERFESRIRA